MSFANPSALMAAKNSSIFTPNHLFRLKITGTRDNEGGIIKLPIMKLVITDKDRRDASSLSNFSQDELARIRTLSETGGKGGME